MSFNIGHIDGGTGSGKKRSLLAAHQPWECDCREPSIKARYPGGLASRDRRPVERPGWMKNCKDCGARRPS